MEDNSWRKCLLSSLTRAWEDQIHTDLTIVTKDRTLHAHKIILVAASPYFRAMLNTDLTERNSSCISLDTVQGESMKAILTYIYSGSSPLTEENVTEVLSLAEYFQISSLKNICCIFIKNHLTPCRSLLIYELALLHRCQDLAQYAFQMALKNCSEVLSDSSFLSLQPVTLISLYKQSVLDVASEDELFKALTCWVAVDSERRQWYGTLLSLLHESQLNSGIREVYREKLGALNPPSCSSSTEISEIETRVKKKFSSRHKKDEELIIVFGGESSGRVLSSAECIALGWASWCCSIPCPSDEADVANLGGELKQIAPMNHPRTHPAIAVKENIAYIIGGMSSSNFIDICEAYDIDSNQWISFASLPVALHSVEAVFAQDNLYVIGGQTGKKKEQNALLMYNSSTESWVFRTAQKEGRVHFGTAGLHGSIYVIGGIGLVRNGQKALTTCEKYDPEIDTWTQIAPLNQRRAYHRVAVIGDFLYAIGGYDGKKWLDSVERYDPLNDHWTHVSPMISTRSSFGVTVSYGRIYCIGGFSGDAVLNSVEKYNPRTDTWYCVQSMRLRRYGVVAATLTIPKEKLLPDEGDHLTSELRSLNINTAEESIDYLT